MHGLAWPGLADTGWETLLSPQAGSSLWAPFCSVCGGDCFPGATGLCNPLDSQSSPVLQSVCLCLSPSPRGPPTGFATLLCHSLLRSRPSSFPQLRVQGRLGPVQQPRPPSSQTLRSSAGDRGRFVLALGQGWRLRPRWPPASALLEER